MKKSIYTLLALLCFTFAANAQGVKFFKGTVDQAFELAAKENKLVFVDVYAVWCGPCKRLVATTFKDAKLGEYLDKHFVSIQLDSERGEGPSFHTKYQVSGLPTLLFLDKDGNAVHRFTGYRNAEKFLAEAQKAVELSKTPNELSKYMKSYEQEKNNVSFLKEYLQKLHKHQAGAYYKVVEQYLQLDKSFNPNSKEGVDFLYHHMNSLTFGGVAQQIFEKYMGSYDWDKYVRKDIRKQFQNVWMTMAKNTAEYAIDEKNPEILKMNFRESVKHHLRVKEESAWLHYYKMTQDGQKYKEMAVKQIEAYIKTLDPSWNMKYVDFKAYKKENPLITPFCKNKSGMLRSMVAEYAKFATQADKDNLLRWGEKAYSMLDDPENTSFYAKIQYMYGNKELGIQMMKDNLEATKEVGKYDANKKDMDLMEKGQPVPVTF